MSDKIKALTELLKPVVETDGIELYDIEFVREGGEKILRLYIDRPDGAGVDLNDCERTSRTAEAVLDKHDPIAEAYALEVSSPGIERKLTRDRHFSRYVGHEVHVRLYAPQEGRKNFRGTLTAFENNTVVLQITSDQALLFPRESIAACRLAIF